MLAFGLTLMSAFSLLLLLIVFRLFNKPWCGGVGLLGTVITGYLIGIVSTLIGILIWVVEWLI